MNFQKPVPQSHSLDGIHTNARISIDEFESTILLANTLVENALKMVQRIETKPNSADTSQRDSANWNEYTNAIFQILDKFGVDLQELLDKRLGQEVMNDVLGDYKIRIKKLIERR